MELSLNIKTLMLKDEWLTNALIEFIKSIIFKVLYNFHCMLMAPNDQENATKERLVFDFIGPYWDTGDHIKQMYEFKR